jgi:MerR family transcriptional regulator/heat shock protein HspR
MAKEFWTKTEVVDFFQIDERFLVKLEEEEIICPHCQDDPLEKRFTPTEMEKLRIAKILVEDMGVNLAGVEVILRMRQNMIEMRNQFDTILEDLVTQISKSFER